MNLVNFELKNIKTKLSDATFCALDIETTGNDPTTDQIVEIGVVKFTLKMDLDIYESLVKPQTPIPEDVIKIHGITDGMVANSPTLGEIVEPFTRFIKDAVIVVHNPEFDLSFIDIELKKYGIIRSELSAFDTVRLAQKCFPDLKSHKLNALCRAFNIPLKHHRALSDASGCMELFRIIVKTLDPGRLWTLEDLRNYHGIPVRPRARTVKRFKNPGILKGIKLGDVVTICYKDAEGRLTIREIVPKEFIRFRKKRYILAHCTLRNDDRYFLVNRIVEVL